MPGISYLRVAVVKCVRMVRISRVEQSGNGHWLTRVRRRVPIAQCRSLSYICLDTARRSPVLGGLSVFSPVLQHYGACKFVCGSYD